MKNITVAVKIKEGCEDLPLPKYQSEYASGMDLLAAVEQDVTLEPGQIKLIPTGLYISVPSGFEAQVRPRSGLALKHGITVVNAPGTIDSDYRGEVGVILGNVGREPFRIERGMRIAQMVFQQVVQGGWEVVPELDDTVRGEGGFGHTGS